MLITLGILGALIVAALFANSTTASANLRGRTMAYKVIAAKATITFKRGAHVMTVGGYLTALADTSTGVYAGRMLDPDGISGTPDGTTSYRVEIPEQNRYQEFKCSGFDATCVGKYVAAGADDATVVLNSASTNHVIVGRVVQFLSATAVIVDTGDRAPVTVTADV